MPSIRLLLCSFCLVWTGAAFSHASFENFKTMMGQRGVLKWSHLSQEELWRIPVVEKNAKKAFENYSNGLDYLKHPALHTIPKTIHVIWIGPRPFPEQSIANLLSWKKYHPTWDLFFWTDSRERPLPIEGMKRRLLSDFDLGPFTSLFRKSTNWAEKSDLLRYMIIYKEGGLYTDHDVTCIRPFDSLVEHYDFIAGYAPLHNYCFSLNNPFSPNNGIIISSPCHPIMQKTISRLCSKWKNVTKSENKSVGRLVIARTFDPFTYCASHYINIEGYRNILLPASYLHSAHSFTKEIFDELIEHNCVYAIHHFDSAWLPNKPPPQ